MAKPSVIPPGLIGSTTLCLEIGERTLTKAFRTEAEAFDAAEQLGLTTKEEGIDPNSRYVFVTRRTLIKEGTVDLDEVDRLGLR